MRDKKLHDILALVKILVAINSLELAHFNFYLNDIFLS